MAFIGIETLAVEMKTDWSFTL